MFTGIIEEAGIIKSIDVFGRGRKISIASKIIIKDLKIGDSIAINGVCLTATHVDVRSFSIDAVEETINKTTFSKLKINKKVNLERSLRAEARLDGHLVQGHVDNVCVIEKIQSRKESWLFYFSHSKEYANFIVPTGSVSIDGVSLTVAKKLSDTEFMVSIIPHTYRTTIFQYYKVGDTVNIEYDVVGKYIVNYINGLKTQFKLTNENLLISGY